VLSVSTALWHLVVVLVTLSFGFGASTPTINGALSKLGKDHGAGGVLGLSQSMSALGRVVGPAAAGLAFAQLGRQWPYRLCAVLMVLSGPLLFALRSRRTAVVVQTGVSDVAG
jgi:MFS family permease